MRRLFGFGGNMKCAFAIDKGTRGFLKAVEFEIETI